MQKINFHCKRNCNQIFNGNHLLGNNFGYAVMYHPQQNKCYPKGVYLLIQKLHSTLAVANLLAHNNISQICYCSQISLQSAAVNCSFSENLTLLGVTFILLAMVPVFQKPRHAFVALVKRKHSLNLCL